MIRPKWLVAALALTSFSVAVPGMARAWVPAFPGSVRGGAIEGHVDSGAAATSATAGDAHAATGPAAGAPAPAAAPLPAAVPPDAVQQLPAEVVGVDQPLASELEPEVKKRDKVKRKKWGDMSGGEAPPGTLELSGRVIGQAEFNSVKQNLVNVGGVAAPTTVRSLDLSVPSARLQASYQTPVEWLSAKIEIDIAGRPDMKDGYVQAKGRNLAARMGQFKVPVAAIETESPWVLPLARRGMIHELLVDWLDYGGRRPGALFTGRLRGGLKPRLSVGAFQGSALQSLGPGLRDTDRLFQRSLSAQSLIARGQIEVAEMNIGAYYEYRVGSPAIGQYQRYWTSGVDLTVDSLLGAGGLRVWADAVAGGSWYRQGIDPGNATFVAGRVLVAYRWGGVVPDELYVEPFGFGGLFDPDTSIGSDLAWEAAAGFNVGFYHRARVTLQGEINRADRNFPALYFGGQDPDRLAAILEAGVAF